MSLSGFEFDNDRTCTLDNGLSFIETNQQFSLFEQLKHYDGSLNEYWLARELQPLLGYKQWRQFEDCVERATLACRNSGGQVLDHFADARKMIQAGKGANRELQDYRLSRYGCYLSAMNGDPRKPEIAAAQTYFAVKTREAEVLPTQIAEIELKKLELHLLQAKQQYLDRSYAIQLSTSPAMLAWLRGETPPPARVESKDRFVDSRTGKEVGSSNGRSLTQLITEVGLNPKSKRDKDRVKHALKRWGFDYDRMENWSEASYLRKYPVLEDQVYDQALKAVMGEVMTGESEQNLFVHQMQQAALSPQEQPRAFQGVEP